MFTIPTLATVRLSKLFSLAIIFILVGSSAGVQSVQAAPVVLQVGLIKFEADSNVDLGGGLMRLDGNVKIGHAIYTNYLTWLGLDSSLTVDVNNKVVTAVKLGGEFGISSGSNTYTGTSGTLAIDIPNQIVTLNGSLRFPATIQQLRMDGRWVLNWPNRSLNVTGRVYDDFLPLSTSWPVLDISLNLEILGQSSCFIMDNQVGVPISFTDKISADAGAKINICPEAGYYLLDLDLSLLKIDLSEFSPNLQIELSPGKLEELRFEFDSKARKLTFHTAAGLGPKGLAEAEFDAGTVITWNPWTWNGSIDMGISVYDAVELKAANVAFKYNFTTMQFEFTTVSEFYLGDWLGIRTQANEAYLSLRPFAFSGRGQLFEFDGSVNPLAHSGAWTSFLFNFSDKTYSGGFESDFNLFGFPIQANGQSWSLTSAGISANYRSQLISSVWTEMAGVFGPNRVYGTLRSELRGPFNIVLGAGGSYTFDRVGYTFTTYIFGVPVTLIRTADGKWNLSYGVLGIAGGLNYLSDRHALYPNGSWSNDVGITGLGALSFMNFGFGEGHSDVNNAIQYILSNVKPDGSIWSTYSYQTYHTSLALLALKATHNPAYNDEIEAAKNWLINSQWDENCQWGSIQPSNWYYGGFGYGSHSRPDLSNTQWALLAIHAAGVPDEDPVWDKSLMFLTRTQNWTTNDQPWTGNDGGFIYFPGSSLAGGTESYGSMTGAGIWSLALSGLDPTEGRFDAALNWAHSHYTWDYNPTTTGSYGANALYYYYVSMAKALTMARQREINNRDWFNDLASELIERQQSDGRWYNGDGDYMEYNPELVTTYAVLTLETRTLNPNEDLRMVIIMHSPADIHLYDPSGRHTGLNYETGQIDTEIPASTYVPGEPQTIEVAPPIAGSYTIQLLGTGGGDYTFEIIGMHNQDIVSQATYTGSIEPGQLQGTFLNVTAIEGALTIYSDQPETLASIQLAPSKLNLDGGPGSLISTYATVSEIGGEVNVENAQVSVSSLTGTLGGEISAANFSFQPENFDLPAGSNQTVNINISLDSKLVPDTYQGLITVETLNAGAKSIPISIQVSSNLPPELSVPSEVSAQYSDWLTFNLAADDPNDPGENLNFTVSALPDGFSFIPNGDGTATISGFANIAPNSYPIEITVTDPQGLSDTKPVKIVITQEDARTTYDGPLMVSTSCVTCTTAIVPLRATLQDITAVTDNPAYDPDPGDIRNAMVTFVNRNNANQVLCTASIVLLDADDTKVGTATCDWTTNIGSSNGIDYAIGTIVSGYYDRDSREDDTVVVVSKPTSNFITGGGYFVNQKSGGFYTGDTGLRTNFGFNIKFTQKLTNLQGRVTIIVRQGGRVYQIKSTALSSLVSVPYSPSNPRSGLAELISKATVIDVTDPLKPTTVVGNAKLNLKMRDRGEPGSTDLIGISLWSSDGHLLFSNNWDGKQTIQQLLDGGNLSIK